MDLEQRAFATLRSLADDDIVCGWSWTLRCCGWGDEVGERVCQTSDLSKLENNLRSCPEISCSRITSGELKIQWGSLCVRIEEGVAWRNSMNSESKTVTPSFIVQNLLSEYLPAASTVLNSMFDRGLFAVADFNDDHKAAACRYSIFEKGFMEAIGLKACKSCGHRIEPDVARYKKALEAVRKETECDLTVRLRSVSDMEVLKNIWNQLANGHSTRWLLPSFATAYIVHTRSLRFDSLSKAADGIWEDIWLRLDDPTTLFFIQNRDSFLEVRC